MIPEGIPSDNPEPAERGRPVVGFLVDCIDDSYQNELLSTLIDAAHQLGASLLCFAGGNPSVDGSHSSPRSRVYDLVGPETVDALILSAGTLESGLGAARVERFIRKFGDIPLVSIGVPIHGVPSVVLDNVDGMQRLVSHLIRVHGCQNIAFIRGPSINDEAEARHRGYLNTLRSENLKPNPALVVEGDFLAESGRRAIEVLLDERGAQFDALIGANDDMALAAMRELARRGIRTPRQVAVAGFDDDRPSRYAQPALTTARQPLATIALHAVKLALGQLTGKVLPGRVVLDTELVVRRSCGCPLREEEIAAEAPKNPRRGEEEGPLVQKGPDLVREMVAAAPDVMDQARAERVVEAFIGQLRGRHNVSFAAVWDDLLAEAVGMGTDLRCLQSVVSELRRGAIPALVELQGMLIRAETMLHEARVLLANQIHCQEAQKRFVLQRATQALSGVAQSLIVSSDVASLVRSVARSLAQLDIPSGFIALCDLAQRGCRSEGVGQSRLVLAHRAGMAIPDGLIGSLFPARELAPAGLLQMQEPRAYVVQPLFFGELALGFAVFELGPRDGTFYEAMRAQISAALGAMTLDNEKRAIDERKTRLLRRGAVQISRLQRALRGVEEARSATALGGTAAATAVHDGIREAEERLRSTVEELGLLAGEWVQAEDVDSGLVTMRPDIRED